MKQLYIYSRLILILLISSLQLKCNTIQEMASIPSIIMSDFKDALDNFARKKENSILGYYPISTPIPLPKIGASCNKNQIKLSEFPNEDMRVFISKIDESGSLINGVSGSISEEHSDYAIFFDYIKYKVLINRFELTTFYKIAKGSEKQPGNILEFRLTKDQKVDTKNTNLNDNKFNELKWELKEDSISKFSKTIHDELINRGYLVKVCPLGIHWLPSIACHYEVSRSFDKNETQLFDIPTYIGIGVRVKAIIRTNKKDVNISGLSSLAFASNAKEIVGSLTIQSIGIAGETITNLLPSTTDINPISIQSAIQSVSLIRSKIYDTKIDLCPQLLAIDNQYAGFPIHNLIIKSLIDAERKGK
jgi:hypothetical protein